MIRAVAPRPVLIRVEGFKLYIRLDDWAVGMRIALRRRYEAHVVEAMRPYLTPGATVADVGANIGFYTVLAGGCIGPAGRVFAFEPAEENCELIQMSARANGLQNVIVKRAAVADRDGTIWFGKGAGGSNGMVGRERSPRFPLEVPAVRLDTCLRDETRVDVVKMDVEGAEGMVLDGMMEVLTTHRPVVFSEFQPYVLGRISGTDPRSFLETFEGLGYDLHVIPRRGRPSGPHSADAVIDQAAASRPDHLDLLARPRAR